MDFLSQYENLQVVAEGETKAFRARRVSDQRAVLLHQLNSNPRSGRQVHLLAMLLRHSASLRPGSTSPILGIEEQGDSVWVITEDRPEMANLLDWMDRQAPAKSDSSPSPSETVAGNAGRIEPSTALAGGLEEKTVLFATRLAAADSSPVVDVDATMFTGAVHQGGDASAPEAANSASEATRAFPAVKLPSPPVNEAKPQDSTAMFQTPAPAVSGPEERTRAIPAPPLPSSEATVFLQAPPAGSGKLSSPPQERAVDPPMNETEASGEFTMLFRKPPAALASEQKPRFMGFTAPTTPEKARFIESAGDSAPLPDLSPIVPPGQGEALKPSGSFTFRPPAASEADKTQAFELPSFPSAPADETWPPTQSNQPGEFTQVFQRPPASSRPEAERQEPGAFTRIFQIPVGSDLLSAPESQVIFSSPAVPPAVQSDLADLANSANLTSPVGPVDAGVPVSPAAPPPAVPMGGTPKVPAMPAFKAPVIPSVKPPVIPAIPPLHAGGGGKAPVAVPAIPKVSAPRAPALAAPKMPALPKAPKLEKPAAGAGPSILPLVLIFGGIVLVAVLVVLFFVTKH